MPKLFGFPGKNADGKNVPPKNVLDTTPGARQLAWITCLWFWMTNRSGYATSCHACMQKPTVYGIGGANIIVNNQSGVSSKGKSDTSWAGAKIEYYKRICKILGFKNAEVTNTIVVPKALPK